MRGGDEKTIGELISEFYKERKGSDYMEELKLVDSWKNVVGDFIAFHTLDLNFKNGILYVRVDADSLRNELVYHKTTLIERLNGCISKQLLKDIVFR